MVDNAHIDLAAALSASLNAVAGSAPDASAAATQARFFRQLVMQMKNRETPNSGDGAQATLQTAQPGTVTDTSD